MTTRAFRRMLLDSGGEKRVDGRRSSEIRDLDFHVDFLPKVPHNMERCTMLRSLHSVFLVIKEFFLLRFMAVHFLNAVILKFLPR